jgi:phosphohistidine phosphatase
MKLYVMRHAHAPSIADAGVRSDAERPLSDKGHADARAQAQKLAGSGAKPRLILHSPLRRAVETAREAAEVLGVPAREFVPLSNEMGPQDLSSQLSAPLAEKDELLIVGHQPQVGELAAWLSGQLFDFKPAGVVALQIDGGPSAKSARLIWAQNP